MYIGPTTIDGAYVEASLAKPIERHDPLKNLNFDDDYYRKICDLNSSWLR